MKIVDWFARKLGYVKSGMKRRNYAAANTDRLVFNWPTVNTSADAELRGSLTELRARSRQLARDNDYAKRFLALCKVNIIGPQGILVQSKATLKSDTERLDTRLNKAIEAGWYKWGRPGTCTADGTLSWVDAQGLFVQTLATDGEVLIQKIKSAENQLSLKFLEADQLDSRKNEVLSNGSEIRMGVEVDNDGKPAAYWLFPKHPGDAMVASVSSTQSKRIPADQIIHAFVKERPSQTRGVPWMHSAMLRLKMLGGYEEAELVAARVCASKMGFFETPTGDEFVGEAIEAGTGAKITTSEPGTFGELPVGQKFTSWDPTHPAGNFDPFTKAILRGVASGVNVSYHSLTGDLTDVNYSSIRSGTLEQRDNWRILQRFVIDHFCQPVFEEWLFIFAMLNGLGVSEFDRMSGPDWNVRGWEWVDPLKDINASVVAIENGLSTRTLELAKQGLDFEEVLDQLAFEKDLAAEKGVVFPGVTMDTGNGNQDNQVSSAAA